MRDTGRHTVTLTPSVTADPALAPAPFDALTNPDSDGLIGAALTLWPQGSIWGTPDGAAMDLDSRLARITRVMIDTFVSLYRRAFLFAREATVSGVDQLLPDWEREYGLPDRCDEEDQSTAERIARLAARVMAENIITPGEFIRLAATYGFVVAIEEPDIFGCGFSECGGEHECGSPYEEVYFIVRVRDLQVTYFRVDEGVCGADPLFDIGAAVKLLCLFRDTAPAWTIPVLGSWRYFGERDELPGPMIFGGSGIQLS